MTVVSELEDWLAGREYERQARLSGLKRSVFIGAAAGVVIWIVLAIAGLGGLAGLAGLAVMIGIVLRAVLPLVRLHREIKHEMNAKIAGALGLSYASEPDSPARFDAFREHGLLPSYETASFEDHFAGEAQGADFEFYEARLRKQQRSNDSTGWTTVFRGVLIRIGFPKPVEGVTVVARDKGLFNAIEKLGKHSPDGRALERVGLVDPQFEDKFEVYGTDQVMARYLLTPSFMERLLKLEERLDGQNLRCVLDDTLAEASGHGELLIAAETGNRFEGGSVFTPLTERARIDELAGEIELIREIVETLLEPARSAAQTR